MAPKAKPRARSKSSGPPSAKATTAKAKSPAPKAEPKAKSSGELNRDTASEDVAKAEALIRDCLVEDDITKCDVRVLDIAICQAKLGAGVDADLLARAEQRMSQYREFEAEFKQKAEQLRTEKAAAIAKDEKDNAKFKEACDARRQRKKSIEELFDAVGDSEVEKVRSFIRDCTNSKTSDPAPLLPVDVEDHEGNTALSEAACYGEAEIVKLLIRSGAHLDTRNSRGKTPIFRAAYNGHSEVVELLIDSGADASIETIEGEPPGKYGTPDTKALISSWNPEQMLCPRQTLTALQCLPKPWPLMLREACRQGDSAAAISVAKAAANGETRSVLRTVVDFENMVDGLWIASATGHVDLTRALISEEADVNSFSETGLTCLMIACRKGHTCIVQELLKSGANTSLRSEQGRLALDYARESSDTLADLILAHCQHHKDWTTLDEATRQAGGNKAMSRDALTDLLDDRHNASASDRATAALRGLSCSQLREGGEDYQRLLEERALADVMGFG